MNSAGTELAPPPHDLRRGRDHASRRCFLSVTASTKVACVPVNGPTMIARSQLFVFSGLMAGTITLSSVARAADPPVDPKAATPPSAASAAPAAPAAPAAYSTATPEKTPAKTP